MESPKKSMMSGMFYTALNKYSSVLITLLISAILGRLLTPEQFGVVAVATVIITFFSIFADMGIGSAIIQHKDLDKEDIANIFSFTFWTGVMLSAIFFACSWLIASLYEAKELVLICQLLSIQVLFASANIVPNAMMFRDKRFRFIAIRTVIIQSSTGAVAIAAALLGAGMYALLINPILSAVVQFGVNCKVYPQKLRFSLGLVSVKKIFAYSAYQFMFSIINYFSRNLDKLLMPKYLGVDALGYYEKSYRLMILPIQNITSVFTPVMHPVMSDYKDDLPRMAAYYTKILRLLAFVGLPLSALLYFAAGELMLIVFGPQWGPSVPAFRILALSVGLQIMSSSSGSIFQAAGSTRNMFWSGVITAVSMIAGIMIGLTVFGTMEAVAWGITLSYFANFFQCYVILYRGTFKLPVMPVMGKLVSPLILTALVTAALWALSAFMPAAMPLLPSLIIKTAAAGAVSVAYVQLTGEYDFIRMIKQRKI